MIKKNLLKTVMLGLCMATITTGSAYATLAEDTTPSATEEVSDQSKALYAKQGEIDKLLFEANAKEIEKLGFMVNYTGVVEDNIEIGISPYNEDNANYIYELVGKDGVKVIEFDQSVIYASGAAPDTTTEEDVIDPEVMDKEDIAVDSDQGTGDDAGVDDKEVQIQIESTTTDDVNGEEKVYKTTSDNAVENRTIAATDEKAKDDVSTPIIVLSIVGGAALLGGAVLLTNKKKASK
jgi:hypothetical protein